MLLMQAICLPLALAPANTGNNKPAKSAIIAITTSNSINVNARLDRDRTTFITPPLKAFSSPVRPGLPFEFQLSPEHSKLPLPNPSPSSCHSGKSHNQTYLPCEF